MTPPATTTAWAIKAPDGTIQIWKFAASKFMLDAGDLEAGYRCVRVRIEEVAE